MSYPTVTEFFRLLPTKKCMKCHGDLAPLADCYMTTCFTCQPFTYYSIHSSQRSDFRNK